MFTISILIASVFCANPVPSTNGKFFYTSMRAGSERDLYDVHGTHRVDVLLSDKTQHVTLGINTDLYTLAVISNQCPENKCDVKNKYDHYNSTTYKFNNTFPATTANVFF